MRHFKLHSLWILLPLFACTETIAPSPDAGSIGDLGAQDTGVLLLDGGINEERHPDDWTGVGGVDAGGAVLDPIERILCRSPKRVSVDQLRRTIPELFAGETWNIGDTEFNLFDFIGRTLGEADYLAINSDNLEPTPLFMKFMDNMASKVCLNALIRDTNVPAEERVLMRYEDVEENLRYLRLRWHGIYVPPTSTEGIDDLVTLHQEMDANNPFPGTDFAWFGVCVAMITSPEFYSY